MRWPGMLLVGAAGRNVGKTEFACSVVRRLSPGREVIGVKVTTVHAHEGGCPRGGEGCGACASLTEGYRITDEAGGPPGKDTSRLLASGAGRVFWLRVRPDRLPDGAAALRALVAEECLCVCESNSLRLVVEPDLFVIVRDLLSGDVKPSVREVLPLADALVSSDGQRFDPAPESFSAEAGRWAWTRPASAIVLAGGRSSRMGRDKALLPVGDRPMIEHIVSHLAPHFEEILISAGDSAAYEFLGRRVVPDRRPDCGPLMGVATALAASRHDVNLVVTCDVPSVSLDLVARLLRAASGADGAVLCSEDGYLEPLFAVYRRSILPAAEAALQRGERRIISLCDRSTVRTVPIPAGGRLDNLNTVEDHDRWVQG